MVKVIASEVRKGNVLDIDGALCTVMKAESILKKSCLTILLIPAPRALSTDCGSLIFFSSELYKSLFDALILLLVVIKLLSTTLNALITSLDTIKLPGNAAANWSGCSASLRSSAGDNNTALAQ